MSDPSHAHAVFIEITFGLNTLFAIYKEFREYITTWFRNMVSEYVASIQSVETRQDKARVNHVCSKVEGIADNHLAFQNRLFPVVALFAVLFAILAPLILYFDWIEWTGKLCAILIAPFPVYAITLFCNYGVFRFRGWRWVSDFHTLTTKFEPPQKPPAPPPAPPVK